MSSNKLNNDDTQLIIGCVLIVATSIVPGMLGNAYWTHSFLLINLFIVVSIFQNFLMHDGGQTSFGQGAIFGVGAYTAAIAASMHGLPYGVAALVGIGCALLAGLLFALPALRVQGYYLGFVTMSAATVFPEMMVAFDQYTNGVNGISLGFKSWSDPLLLGVSPLSLAVAGLACGSLGLHVFLRKTRFGRRMKIASSSPEAAQSLGISPGLMRCAAFTIVSLGTGVAGVLYGPVVGFLSPDAFSLDLSVLFFFAVIVGGRGQILGTILGVWTLYLVPNVLLAEFTNYRLLLYGLIALVAMLVFPDGLVGTFDRWRQRRRPAGAPLNLHVANFLGTAKAPLAGQGSEVAIDVRAAVKQFGSVVALDNVSFQVRRGEIHGLVGANGSGKTTLLNVFNGFIGLSAGSIVIDAQDVTTMTAYRIARLGVGRTFQKPRIFPSMSLWENIQIGMDAFRGGAHATPALPDVMQAMKTAMQQQSVELVPHGQRRLVEVVRVVLKGAHILFFDEPAAGLSPQEREEFKTLLCRLRDEFGKTIVLVEHDLDLVWEVADTITVLEAGKLMAHGKARDIADNPAVRKLFIEPAHA